MNERRRYGRPILRCGEITIYGWRYSRGTTNIYGYNRPFVGYRLSCSACGWDRRFNVRVSDARYNGKNHIRREHGLNGPFEEVLVR